MFLKSKYVYPKNVEIESDYLKLKNRRIYFEEINSIRVYAVDTRMSYFGIPMQRNLTQEISIKQKNEKTFIGTDKEIVIYMKPISKMLGFNPLKPGSKGKNKFDETFVFSKFLEKKTFENRLGHYLNTETKYILFKYFNYIFYKDGTIFQNGKFFSSLNSEEYKIRLYYKKIGFEKKNTNKIKKFIYSQFSA